MASKSGKTKKWKLQVIHALDFPPDSCFLPALPGRGSLHGIHVRLSDPRYMPSLPKSPSLAI